LGFDFDIYGRQFESIVGAGHKYYVGLKVRMLQKELRERLSNLSTRAFLDVGCGTGLAEEFFGTRSERLVGVDVAGSLLEIANGRCGHADFVQADSLEMPFADNTFDVTFSFALMHHLKRNQRWQALKEMARVTKLNRYVLTFEHNPTNPLVRHIVNKCSVDEEVELVHPAELVRLHREVGLSILGVRYLVFFPRLLSFLVSLEPLLQWVPFGGQYEIVASKAV